MSLKQQLRAWIGRPEAGAALLYVALALVVIKELVVHWMHGLPLGAVGLSWYLVSLLVAAWMAFTLLRRRPGPRAMRRLLLVALVHAIGAFRFFEFGMVVLAVLPLFALLPALLFPETRK